MVEKVTLNKRTYHFHELTISGSSGSGKTTLIKKLLQNLSDKYRIFYGKHDAHSFEIDHSGKDTFEARREGAKGVSIYSQDQWATIQNGSLPLFEQKYLAIDYDFALIEGHKHTDIQKILFLDERDELYNEYKNNTIKNVVAFITPALINDTIDGKPCFHRDNIEKIQNFILQTFKNEIESFPLNALIVVSGSTIRFLKNKMINWKKILPWVLLSIPMAFLGGLVHLPEKFFLPLLAILLLFTGIRIIFNNYQNTKSTNTTSYNPNFLESISLGAFLGFISGIVGIGGGIFLSPIMTYWKMDEAKNIAIVTTLFIFVNSLSALLGKLHNLENFESAIIYWPILLIVFAGGQIGNHWCVYKATDKQLTTLTGALSILASFALLYKLF